MNVNIKNVKVKKRKQKNLNDKKQKRIKLQNSDEIAEYNDLDNLVDVNEVDNDIGNITKDTEIDPEIEKFSNYVEEKIKFSNDFKMVAFREKLKGNNFITELRHFLYLAKKNEKFINKYFQKRGKPLELVESMERVDKTHLYHVSYICEAFQMVLMEVLINQKEHTINAINASRYFLKSHSEVIEKLLISPCLLHRKIILKLLTAIVCLEPELGRLLISFDFFEKKSNISNLLSHSMAEKNESETVRKTFIHFILSYFVDGNIVLIKNILDKHNLLHVLFSGLIFDDHITVSVILNTIKKYVIENLNVLKTMKFNLFNFECIKHFMNLYDWKGPQMFGKDLKSKNEDVSAVELNEDYIKSKDSVRETVHEFLILLLSSRKYGVAFDSMKNFKQKHNLLQRKLMMSLHFPWTDDLKKDLIVKVLIACPDIARIIVKHYGKILNPEKTGKLYWIKAANLITEIISALNPSILGQSIKQISLTEYTYWIKDICLGNEILVHLKDNKNLLSFDPLRRLATLKLLLAMFNQFCNYMIEILNSEKHKGNELRRFKLDLIDHIFVNFPTMENILISSYEMIKVVDFTDNNQLEHFDVLLDLVLLVATHHRTFFNQSGLVIDYMKVLEPLFTSEELSTKNVKLELKAVKTILLLTPLKLSPNSSLYEKALNCFVNVFINGEKHIQKEAGNLLRGIFLNANFFAENNVLEIDIWLQALKFFDFTTVELITLIFYACFMTQSEDVAKELDNVSAGCNQISKTNQKYEGLQNLFKKIEANETVEGYVETITLSKLLPYICLKVDQEEKITKFLELISLLLFHYLPYPDAIYEVHSSNLKLNNNYMKNILKKKKIQNMENMDEIPYYNEIHQAILNGECTFFEIFEDKVNQNDNKIRFLHKDREYVIKEDLENERLVLLYIYLTIFVSINLTETDKLEQNHSKAIYQFLTYFLKSLHVLNNDVKSFQGVIFGEKDLLPKTEINYLKSVLKYIYCNHVQLIQNVDIFEEVESKQIFLKLICEITDYVHELISDEIDDFLINFQQKIVNQIGLEVRKTIKNHNKPKCVLISKVLDSFRISKDQCTEIFRYLCQLDNEDFLDENNQQNKSIYFEILNYILTRLSELKQSINDKNICEKIAKIYIYLISNNEKLEINLEKLEETFYNFLIVSHQCIEILPTELFEKILECKKLTKSTIKLATLLMERNTILQKIFLENINKNLSKKELIYPLLNTLITQYRYYQFDESILKTMYQEFKNGFMKTIEKPQKSGVIYKENIEVSIYFVNESMPMNECIDFAQKVIRTDAVEIYQLKLINSIYDKAIRSLDVKSEEYNLIFINFLNNMMQLYNIIFRRDNFDDQKTNYLNYIIYIWIKSYFNKNPKKNVMNFDKINKSQHWNLFYKNCLKYGMQVTEEILINQKNADYLKILAHLCMLILNKDDSDNNEIYQMYNQILSNSKFSDIISNNKQNAIKTQIFNLLLVLAQKNTKVLDKKHIPIFLSSYEAKLSNCDRYILALIQYYEENGINLYEFKPFIWGKTASTHYSLTKIEAAKLQQQEPSIAEVMSLVDRFISDFTVKHFPVWRKLNTLKQLPEENFENLENLISNFGSNIIEKQIEYEIFTISELKNDSIESSNNKIDYSLLKLYPKKNEIYEDCYDPAFIIPLMCMSFASENQCHPVRPVQNGLLSIVFAAMSSQDKEMRLASGCCQLRYREHIENKKFFDQPLWIQTYDNIQNGLSKLQIDWIKHKKHGIPKVPGISGLFLTRAINLLLTPMDPLYKTIVMYLRLKESFNFLCVPEFNVLFHNSEINHILFQKFILEIINDGIKSSSDLLILISNNIFKAIMGFYFSVMSNLDLNLQILSIISSCAKIPASSKLLIDYIGILPWLDGVIEQIEYYKFDTIEGVISILSNLWYSIKIREKDFYNFKYIESVIYKLLLKLSSAMSSRISINNFARYLNILQKTAHENHKMLKEENLDRLLLCAQKQFDDDVWRILNIKMNGSAGVESKECFLKRMKDNNANEKTQLALLNLREFVIKWSQKDDSLKMC